MRFLILSSLVATLLTPSAPAATMTGFPFTDEDLNYSVNWPSGLSLGEAHLHSKHTGSDWSFEFDLDAGVPGFQVKDSYLSDSSPSFCSVSFTRHTSHGGRKADETETVNGPLATRGTSGGGSGQLNVPDCVKDALTFLYFTRRELGQGRVPNAQQMLFGGLYQARLDYAGAQTIQIAEQPTVSDKVTCTIKGPTSTIAFDMYFARDPARTPLLVKVPLAMGAFSMELIR
jgi:hypothetical protein